LYSLYRRSLRPLQEGQDKALNQVISPFCNCIPSENTEGGDQPALKVLVSRLCIAHELAMQIYDIS
jgi:hypothetical protein